MCHSVVNSRDSRQHGNDHADHSIADSDDSRLGAFRFAARNDILKPAPDDKSNRNNADEAENDVNNVEGDGEDDSAKVLALRNGDSVIIGITLQATIPSWESEEVCIIRITVFRSTGGITPAFSRQHRRTI